MFEIINTHETTNREGKPEIFCQISISDELGNYGYAKWLSPREYADYKNETRTLEQIMEFHLPQAKINRQAELNAIQNAIDNPELMN